MPVEFHQDDSGYLAWLRANPTGYVVNCGAEPRADYVVLHRAACHTISGEPTRGEHWTWDYMKVCAELEVELGLWARSRVGVLPARCGVCM